MKRKLIAFAAVLVVATLGLTACGTSTPTPTKTTVPGQLPPAQATELAKKVDVKPGTAVVPGSIKSNTQSLSAACTTAIQPVRDLMKKYKSALLINKQADAKILGATNQAAQKACSPTDYVKWYADEFNGWLNGKTK